MTTPAQIEAAALVITNANRSAYGYRLVDSLSDHDIDPADAAWARVAARAALEAAEATAWEPIASAPKDGRDVFVSIYARNDPTSGRIALVAGFSSRSDSWVDRDDSTIHPPTHWRPLPQPPGEEAAR